MKLRYSNLANGSSMTGFMPCAPMSGTANLVPRPLSDTVNLILCRTVRHNKPHPVPAVKHSKSRPTPSVRHTNLVLCPTVKHSKPRPKPHCQAHQISPYAQCQTQQTSPCASLSSTAHLAPRPTVRHSKPCPRSSVRHNKPHPVPRCQAQQTLSCRLSGTTNLALCSTDRYNKPRPADCQAQQTSPCAALWVMMPQFIRWMRYAGTAWQVLLLWTPAQRSLSEVHYILPMFFF